MRLSGYLYLAGMFSVLIGERLLGGDDTLRWVFTGLGLAVVLAALGLAGKAMASASADQKPAHMAGLVGGAVGLLSLGIYGLGSETVVDAFGLEDDGAARYGVAVSALWPIFWLCGTLPFLNVDRAIAASPVRVPVSRVQEAAWAGLSLALALSFLFPLNYVAAERNERWDFGYFKTARPGSATVSIVENLEEPMRAVLFFPSSSDVTDEVRTYFDQLAGGNLTVEYVDHALEPELAKELKVRDNGYVALVRGEQVERIKIGTDFDSAKRTLKKLDLEIQGALLKVARDERVLYFTVGHGELYWKSGGDKMVAINKLKTALRDRSFKVKELGATQGLADAVPDDAAAVLILGPTEPFLEEEIAALDAYRQSGGSLLVALEPGGSDLSGLIEPMGIAAETQGTLAIDQYYLKVSGGLTDRTNLVTNKFSSHASVTTLSRNSRSVAVAAPGAMALSELADLSEGQAVRTTIKSLQQVWNDLDGDLQFDDGEEERKTWSLGIASSGPVTGMAREGAATGDDGAPEYRAVVLGDATWLSDVFVTYSGNGQLFFDSLAWLSADEAAAGETNSEQDIKIQHTREGQGQWFYGTAFLIPAAFLSLGLVRVRTRRKRGAA